MIVLSSPDRRGGFFDPAAAREIVSPSSSQDYNKYSIRVFYFFYIHNTSTEPIRAARYRYYYNYNYHYYYYYIYYYRRRTDFKRMCVLGDFFLSYFFFFFFFLI